MSSLSIRTSVTRTEYVDSPLSEDQKELVEGYGIESYQVARYVGQNPGQLLLIILTQQLRGKAK